MNIICHSLSHSLLVHKWADLPTRYDILRMARLPSMEVKDASRKDRRYEGGGEKEERDNYDSLHRRVIVLGDPVVEHRCQTLHHSLRHRGMLEVNLCTRDSGLNLLLLLTHCRCSHCQQSRSRSRRRLAKRMMR